MYLSFVVSAYNDSCLNMDHNKFIDQFAEEGTNLRILYESQPITEDLVTNSQLVQIDDEILFPFMTTGLNENCILYYNLVLQKFFILSDIDMMDTTTGRLNRMISMKATSTPANDMFDWDDEVDVRTRFCTEIDKTFHDELFDSIKPYIYQHAKNLVRSYASSDYFTDNWIDEDDGYKISDNATHREIYWYFNISYEDYSTLIFLMNKPDVIDELNKTLSLQVTQIYQLFGKVIDHSRTCTKEYSYKKR